MGIGNLNQNYYADYSSNRSNNSNNIGYERSSIPSNVQYSNNNDNKKINVTDVQPNDGILMQAAETIPSIKRVCSIKENFDKGDLFEAAAAIGLTTINFPEDLRDLKSGAEQVKCFMHGEKYHGGYNLSKYQHEFSFFRGTLLEPYVDLKNTKHPKLAKMLLNWDRTLIHSRLGKKIMNLLGTSVEQTVPIENFNKKTKAWEIAKDINGKERYACKFKGTALGKLTARAMSRTTKIGIGVMCIFESRKIIKTLLKGDSAGEKAQNTADQIAKSGINVVATTAGIAYGGAIGAKYGKGIGSLVGMGIGAILSSKISQKIQDKI